MVGFGLAALLIGRSYRLGTIARMGPGYFPVGVGGLLFALGIVITGRAFKRLEGGWPGLAWRPLAVITAGVALFGLLLNSGGLILATGVLVGVSRLARPEYTRRETIILCLIIVALSVGLFYFGLRLKLQLWPGLR